MADDEIVLNRNFDEVQIIDDATDEVAFIKEIIKSKGEEEDAFFTCDVGELIQQHECLISKMPRVEPFYAIKCNPDPTVVKTMAALNTGFDCASKYEIRQAMACGVPGERIIFSNTVKPDSHIKLAKEAGVEMLTVDGEPELHKIKRLYPEAKVVIRFRCDTKMSMVSFGAKSGCDADTDALELMRIAKDLGLNLYGFNFNVGTQCLEAAAFGRGIRIAVGLVKYAKSLGFQNVKLINIGGGFPSKDCCLIDEFAHVVNEALEEVDSSIKVISEPGRYYVGTAFTLTTFVFGKNTIDEGNRTRHIYYVSDGVYGSFFNSALNIREPLPVPLNKSAKEKPQPTTILGPTLATKDCVVRDCLLPEMNYGDWIMWPNLGAYSIARWRVKKRSDLPAVFPFVKKNIWERNPFLNQSF